MTRQGWWTRDKITTTLKGQIWKALEYTLPSACMTWEQCRHIVAPTLMVALSCMGICRYAERAPLYLPEKYLGLGFHLLHILQITLQLQSILCHWNEPTVSGKLLRSSYKHWIVCLGSWFPFCLSTEHYKLLTPSNWWTALLALVRQYSMDLEVISGLEPEADFPLPQFLTHFALSHLSNNKMVLFNWAWIYFQCCTLKDLYLPGTTTIRPQFLVRPPRNLAKTSKPWPITNPPSTPAFQVWRRIMNLVPHRQFAYPTLRTNSQFVSNQPPNPDRAILLSDGGLRQGIGTGGGGHPD